MSSPAPAFSWRSIILPAYLPTLVYSFGEGALIPVIPVIATERGASLAVAGLVAAMMMVGRLAADLPAGWLVARIGERTAMIGAAVVASLSMLIAVAVPTVFALGLGVLVLGFADAVFGLARHAFLTSYVPVSVRARALSTLGGVHRGGWAVGPFVAAALLAWTGSAESVFWVVVAACAAVVVVLVFLPDPERLFGVVAARREASAAIAAAGPAASEDSGVGEGGADAAHRAAAEQASVFRAIRRYGGVLARIGTGVGMLSASRASRAVILPLWAVSLGMPPEQAALIIGISGVIDFALFYTSGQIMDRWGRLWSAIPGLIGLAAGHLLLAFTHDLPNADGWFAACAIILALANGVTSGIVMTLGADLAPKRHPAPFLGAFRMISDVGQAGSPLLIAALTSLVSIMAASAAVGVLGIVGAVMLWRWVPRYLPKVSGRRIRSS